MRYGPFLAATFVPIHSIQGYSNTSVVWIATNWSMQLRAIHATTNATIIRWQIIPGIQVLDTQQSHHWQVSVTCQVKLVSYLHHLSSDLRDINLQHASLICYAWINIPLVYTQVPHLLKFSCASDATIECKSYKAIVRSGGHHMNQCVPGGHHCCLCIFPHHTLWQTGIIFCLQARI